jgi:hypothetical protein
MQHVENGQKVVRRIQERLATAGEKQPAVVQ